MWFTDPIFPLFLTITVGCFWLFSERYRNLWLLLASYFFYGYSDPRICIPLLAVSLVNCGAALGIERNRGNRKFYFTIAVIGSLAPLVYFKYANFFLHNLAALDATFDFSIHVLLPAGISFYVFQGLAYTADVYLLRHTAEKNLLRFLLFKALFPQLVAGPIERSSNLLEQLKVPKKWSGAAFWSGIDLIIKGFVKKLVVADNVAVYVNMIFALDQPTSLLIVVGTLGFGIQILADFSAYTDIARGCGKLMGFELLENFRYPYLALSPVDFWRRWHISLSQCIRDYVYLPLGGSKVSAARWIVNLLVVWFICGLWHGAAWNFVVWGLFWALVLILYAAAPTLPSGRSFLFIRWMVTFFTIHVGWLLFRIDDLSLIGSYFSRDAIQRSFVSAASGNETMLSAAVICGGVFAVFSTPLLAMLMWDRYLAKHFTDFPFERRVVLLSVALALIVIFRAERNVEFIYFQF